MLHIEVGEERARDYKFTACYKGDCLCTMGG